MAETNSPYTYSGFLDHVYTTDEKEIMTLSVSKQCNFEPEEPLGGRQASFSRVREEDPDKISVVIAIKNCRTEKQMIYLCVEPNLNIGTLFTMSVKQICSLDDLSNMTRQDSTAETLISFIYDQHKHEDGCLYMTLRGPFPELLVKALETQFIQELRKSMDLLKDIINKDFHYLEEKVAKRPHTGRRGGILSFLWRFRTWK